ncbi:unnamed protein product [Thlaspi arvense]|uniref:MBD domain-containing protein n=1 Tax=Thlaspi arvense TaxID=13288 RepID=A0AAU9SLE4_THLAR|nr:unnamed protein product [Thlaspi arvense]
MEKMCLRSFSLLLLLLFTLFVSPAFALKKSYIVYFGSHAHPPQPSSAQLNAVARSHHTFLSSFLGSHESAKEAIFYSYKRHINGFAAVLDENEAAEIAKHPDVLSVFLNKGRKLHTTHSWNFMLLEKNGVVHKSSLWNKAGFGEGTIIANLDTGVWPESKSFSDEGYGAVPARWKGSCQKDVSCNRKLIGAKYFNKGYLAYARFPSNASFETPRDYDGHGSHTLSTAAGNFVPGANVFGVGNGTASGGSPKARVAAYKVCWTPVDGNECFDADMLAAFDAAIGDGVDVISASVGGDAEDYLKDAIAIGSFHAAKNGVTVVCSAGNSGPKPGSVSNVAPWIITVGASSMDREFQAFVELNNGQRFKGTSLSKGLPEEKMYDLINAADAKTANASMLEALLCKKDSLDHEKVRGKIVVCLRGDNPRVEKGQQAAIAGAVGMILCNDKASGNELISDPHVLPASQIDYKDGEAVFSYLNSTKDPKGYIKAPTSTLNTKPAPFMASFSSRGPNTITPGILKPDITAPGVNVIAAFTEAKSPTDLEFDNRRTPFNTESGTSMSCPHISGIVGLLKTLHPQWSPAAIRSAIMTTSRTRDNRRKPMVDQSFNKATPFGYGSGHVQPNKASHPGLVYDLTTGDYVDFLCAIGYNNQSVQLFAEDPRYICRQGANLLDFNYPSITVPSLTDSVTVTRKLKNVGTPATYNARYRQPLGVSISVEPKQLNFSKVGEVKIFRMTLSPKSAKPLGYVFGELTWTDSKHYVRSPIVTSLSCSASKDLVPLVPFPADHHHSRKRQLQIVDPTSFRGKLATGWTVVNRPRSSSPSTNGSVDTYFIEPGTGREFPALEYVQRDLAGEVDDKRLTRAGRFSKKDTRAYEGSRTKQDHRRSEYASRGFRLPKGWKVEERPRRNSPHIDKYYAEPKTGKRFRSLVSVERYLKESRNRTDEQLMVSQYHRGHSKDFSLPDGWIVEEKPRRGSSHIDKFYIEPGTGKKLRSMAAVETYLNGAADSFQSIVHHSQRLSLFGNLNITGFQTEDIDPTPPQKVKWVLTGPGGKMFSAHVGGSEISSSVKQTWSKAFVSMIQGRS